MRAIGWLLVCAAACRDPGSDGAATGALSVSWRTQVYGPIAGFSLEDDGRRAWVGMAGAACRVERSGAITTDVDAGPGDEVVADVSGTGSGSIVVAQSGDRVVFVDGDGAFAPGPRVAGLVAVGLSPVGWVASRQDGADCSLRWTVDGEAAPVATPLVGACGALASGHELAVAAVVAGDEVVLATPDGAAVSGGVGDRVAVDDAAGVIYTATRGEPWVRAVSAEGALLWEVDLGAPVRTLDDLGARQAVVVLVDVGDAGAMRVLASEDGRLLLDTPTPGGADAVRVSSGGSALAVAVLDQLHVFDVAGER